MKHLAALSLICVLLPVAAVAAEPALETPQQQVGYLIGRQMGESFAAQGLGDEINVDALIQGIREALAGKDSQVDPEDARRIMTEFSTRMRTQMARKMEERGATNREDGAAFLSKNAKEDGWQTTESGLQYKVIKTGTGAKPEATDKVTVHYRGTLLDGKEFDSSYERGEPASFPVNGVIAGWTEALQLMEVGSKWELVIPAELAYGKRGAGPMIGPDAVLKFEVELLGIEETAP